MNNGIYHLDDCNFMLEMTSMELEEFNLISINPLTQKIETPLKLAIQYPKILNAKVIITDYNMGVFTGLDVANYLRCNNYKNEIYCFSSENFKTEIIDKLSSLEVMIFNKNKIDELKNKLKIKKLFI